VAAVTSVVALLALGAVAALGVLYVGVREENARLEVANQQLERFQRDEETLRAEFNSEDFFNRYQEITSINETIETNYQNYLATEVNSPEEEVAWQAMWDATTNCYVLVTEYHTRGERFPAEWFAEIDIPKIIDMDDPDLNCRWDG